MWQPGGIYQRVLSVKVTLAGLNALTSIYDHARQHDDAPLAKALTSIAAIKRVRGNFCASQDVSGARAAPDHSPAHPVLATDTPDDALAIRLSETSAVLDRHATGTSAA